MKFIKENLKWLVPTITVIFVVISIYCRKNAMLQDIAWADWLGTVTSAGAMILLWGQIKDQRKAMEIQKKQHDAEMQSQKDQIALQEKQSYVQGHDQRMAMETQKIQHDAEMQSQKDQIALQNKQFQEQLEYNRSMAAFDIVKEYGKALRDARGKAKNDYALIGFVIDVANIECIITHKEIREVLGWYICNLTDMPEWKDEILKYYQDLDDDKENDWQRERIMEFVILFYNFEDDNNALSKKAKKYIKELKKEDLKRFKYLKKQTFDETWFDTDI